ncbi:alpha/beta hydrolase fold domain-containing protein [Allorhodopirellula solitaria]|uniref:Carboxylesterase NlhH n=1 Tax=Allorhodopirellula solitaria TaxID=2527987 RepID=A0A5C5YJP6_9BACT|nr:alpha/beta hydrolase fold domain-containing protein [Allorhodopirellula solitaria]TWT75039.1 Carboxylesterase NlhH [Allorhodopirellula solitaria]
MYRTYLLLAMTLLSSSAFAQRNAGYPPSFDDARQETYKTVDDVDLKLWVFDPPRHESGESRPAIVFFFGGGWRAGNPTQFEQHCRYLASQGMVAITADYRVSSRHHTLANKSVEDAESAVRWIRDNAKRLGIDPFRIVAGGGSAGGHLAACLGVVPPLSGSTVEGLEAKRTSSVPNALALFNPALVLAPFEDIRLGKNSEGVEKFKDITTRTGVPARRISPIHHIHSGLPPTIIFHGEADSTVPFVTAKRYSELATQAGNRCELIGYPDASHGFFNYGRGGEPGKFYPLTVSRLHTFLKTLGYLENPPAISTPDSENVHYRSHLDHSQHAFQADKKGTVAFIGGSITEMDGYRVMVQKDLETRFPETQFTFINAGISSTCSTTGAFRLAEDVLSAEPDLLFVEFAVNDDQDAAHPQRDCIRGMEGILKHARTALPNLDMVVTHFVNPPMLEQLQRGETPTSIGSHERVAAHHGVSTIDLAREVAERITAGTLTWEEYGGTHPKTPGNRIAADMITDLLDVAWSDPIAGQARNESQRSAKQIDKRSYVRGRMLSPSTVTLGEGWDVHRPDWSSLPGSKRGRFSEMELLCSTEIGSECSLDFSGTAIGLFVLAGPDAGVVEYSIDGGETRQLDLYHRYSKGLHYPRTVMLDPELKRGEHRIKIRVAPTKNKASTGHAVRILKIAVNQ